MDDETEGNKLITPCLCKGSAIYVHGECLKNGLYLKINIIFMMRNVKFVNTNMIWKYNCQEHGYVIIL